MKNNKDMKHFQTYESFKKTYGQKITQSKSKDIPIGTQVMYMGERYTVTANDGYMIDLIGNDRDSITINFGQFNQAGQINEKKSSIWKVAYAGKGFYGVYDDANDSNIEGEWPSKKAAQAEADKRNAANESLNEGTSDTILYKVHFKPEYSKEDDSSNTPIKPVFVQMNNGERTKIANYAAIDKIGGFGKTTPDKLLAKDRLNTTEISYTDLFKLVKTLHKIKIHR